MDLKNILKNLKLNENNVSMLLGAAVIVVIGFLVVNYFKNLDNGTTSTVGTTTEENQTKLPTKHVVQAGESLWTIAEKYYQSGYNWVDIQKANNLSNASVITKGQELIIPDVTPKLAGSDNKTTVVATEAAKVDNQKTTATATQAAPQATATPSAVSNTQPIIGNSYTVAHGDNLWTIAVKAYGDGFQWKKIAEANKLKHPGIIHSGNVLTLPR